MNYRNDEDNNEDRDLNTRGVAEHRHFHEYDFWSRQPANLR